MKYQKGYNNSDLKFRLKTFRNVQSTSSLILVRFNCLFNCLKSNDIILDDEKLNISIQIW